MRTEQLIAAIAALEVANMSDVLAGMGVELDQDDIRASVAADLARGMPLAAVVDDDALLGYWRYVRECATGDVFLKSLQLRAPGRSAAALRTLLSTARHCLAAENGKTVRAVVQRQNLRSLGIHRRLGFHVAREHPHALALAIDRNRLVASLPHPRRGPVVLLNAPLDGGLRPTSPHEAS